MKNFLRRIGILLLASIAWASVGCSDGGQTTPPTSSSSGSGGAGGNGSGGSGGGTSLVATPGSELGSAGDVVQSKKYKMIIQFGGSTPGVGAMESKQFKMHSGLVGVTEGVK